MNNNDVARNFTRGLKGSSGSMMSDGTTLYSYNTAIAKRMPNGEIVINNTKYSKTTSTHVSLLKRNIPSTQPVAYTGDKDRGYEFRDFDNDTAFKKHLSK